MQEREVASLKAKVETQNSILAMAFQGLTYIESTPVIQLEGHDFQRPQSVAEECLQIMSALAKGGVDEQPTKH